MWTTHRGTACSSQRSKAIAPPSFSPARRGRPGAQRHNRFGDVRLHPRALPLTAAAAVASALGWLGGRRDRLAARRGRSERQPQRAGRPSSYPKAPHLTRMQQVLRQNAHRLHYGLVGSSDAAGDALEISLAHLMRSLRAEEGANLGAGRAPHTKMSKDPALPPARCSHHGSHRGPSQTRAWLSPVTSVLRTSRPYIDCVPTGCHSLIHIG